MTGMACRICHGDHATLLCPNRRERVEEDARYRELEAHLASCEQCKRANKYVNEFCEIGVALFFAWNPDPEGAAERKISDEEFERMRRDPVNRPRTEH